MTARQQGPRIVHAVPKPTPRRRRPTPIATGIVARRLALAQGHAFEDIRADLDAADANDVEDQIDRTRHDPLLLDCVKMAAGILTLPNLPREARILATPLKAGLVRLAEIDRVKDEHRHRGRHQIDASIEAGRAVVGVHESLLATGAEL